MKHLDEAIRGYERGFYLRNDYYNGINFAYMLNVRAAHTPGRAEAIADFVQARRVRAEVVSICDEWLHSTQPPLRAFSSGFENGVEDEKYLQNHKYWVVASKAEAYLGMEKTEEAEKFYEEAYSFASESWMIETTKAQRARLEVLLANSPLKYIKETGE
jgi:tetratricopeptide (TPR) repeat protein